MEVWNLEVFLDYFLYIVLLKAVFHCVHLISCFICIVLHPALRNNIEITPSDVLYNVG